MELIEAIKAAFAAGNITEDTKNNLTEWLSAGFLPAWAVTAIEELVADAQWSEINDRFFKKIAFGTGGMRGRTIGKSQFGRQEKGQDRAHKRTHGRHQFSDK